MIQHAAFDLVPPGRGAQLRQLLAVQRCRHPAAVHQHVPAVGEAQRLHHVVARAPAVHFVVEEHRVALEELAAQFQALLVRHGRALLRRAARLPVAQRDAGGAGRRRERAGPPAGTERVS
jgi:hypothetical protein